VDQARADAGADRCLAVAAQALAQQPGEFTVSEGDMAQVGRGRAVEVLSRPSLPHLLLVLLRQARDAVAEGSDRLVDILCFLKTERLRPRLVQAFRPR